MLGGFRVEVNGIELARLPTQKTGLLLAYLACFPTRSHPREELIEMLWPECMLDEGRNRLRVALSAIRRRFQDAGIDPDHILEVDRLAARVNPAVCVTDVNLFEQAASGGKDEADTAAHIAKMEKAAALYTGDLLPGFYEEWVTGERERLTDIYATLLRRTGKLLIDAGEYERAIVYVRKSIDSDPLSEATHRTLIRLYMACHRPAAAQRQYETLKAILARELKTTPSAQTIDLAHKLTRPTHPPAVSAEANNQPLTATSRQQLPSVPTSFFGRIDEIASLYDLLSPDSPAGGRFITVTGPVGVGKSRLVIESIASLESAYQNRVYYARVAGFESSDSLLRAIADTLQISAAPQMEVFSAVAEALAQAPSLVILDDADMLGDGAIRILCRILEWAPGLRVVTTSRRVFGTAEERTVNLRPLPLPDEDMTEDALKTQPSVNLFLDRAKSVRPGMRVDAENSRTIISLCRRLEGIPLAMELAAAWVRVLSPESMLIRLNKRFDLMQSGETPGGLYEAISMSFRLMPEHLRRLLTRLSVLRGDWTMAAAEAICGTDTTILDILDLSRRSFLLCNDKGGEMRFRILDTLRDYADDQLGQEERHAIQEAHAQYFERNGTGLAPRPSDQSRWLSEIDLDYENYMAALAWRKQQDGREAGILTCANLWRYWYERGLHAEGLTWLTFFLNRAPKESGRHIEALFGAARFAISLGENATGISYLTEALALARTQPQGRHTIPILSTLVILAMDAHDYHTVAALYREWLALPILPYQIWERMPALQGLMIEANRNGDESLKSACLEYIEDMHASLGNLLCTTSDADIESPRNFGGYTFLELGQTAMAQDDDNAARELFAEGREFYRDCGDDRGVALACGHLACAALRLQDLAAAREYAQEGLAIRRRLDIHRGIAVSLLTLAHIEELRGFPREAEVYRRDADRYACETEWVHQICRPFTGSGPKASQQAGNLMGH